MAYHGIMHGIHCYAPVNILIARVAAALGGVAEALRALGADLEVRLPDAYLHDGRGGDQVLRLLGTHLDGGGDEPHVAPWTAPTSAAPPGVLPSNLHSCSWPGCSNTERDDVANRRHYQYKHLGGNACSVRKPAASKFSTLLQCCLLICFDWQKCPLGFLPRWC